jgi:hypothetical protein
MLVNQGPMSDDEARETFESCLEYSLTGQLLPTCGPLQGVAESELSTVAGLASVGHDTSQAVADAWAAFYEFYPGAQ